MQFHHLLPLYALLTAAACATNANQPTINNLEASALKCDPQGLRYTNPSFKDCSIAVSVLPSSLTEADFHKQGAEDMYKLPFTHPYGTCEVKVEIPGGPGLVERYSWLGVSNAASQLNIACHGIGIRKWKTGGWATVGPRSLIRVSLVRAPDTVVMEGSNATVPEGVLSLNGTVGGDVQDV